MDCRLLYVLGGLAFMASAALFVLALWPVLILDAARLVSGAFVVVALVMTAAHLFDKAEQDSSDET